MNVGPGAPGATATSPDGGTQPAQKGGGWSNPGALLSSQLAASALIGFLVTAIWGVTGASGTWPLWVWLGLAAPVAMHAAMRRALEVAERRERALAAHAAASGVLGATVITIWGLGGGGTFWPIWPLLALAAALAVHRLWGWIYPPARERELAQRVDTLARTRRGALDVQEAELRRIERDLHDGAQARLVALTMRLGRAEERFVDRPDVAGVLREARDETSEALADLRDLARGIAPPVLADRGLGAAVEALRRRAAIPVTAEVRMEGRLAPVVESAAYFVVAEALTNACKHAGGAPAQIEIAVDGARLLIRVSDSGPGGADPDGGGLSGLRSRVEALDGELGVETAIGRGTTVSAELPCGW